MAIPASDSLLDLGCILLDEPIPDVHAALERAADLLLRVHGLRASTTLQRLWAREQRKSTAIGWGMAIPHADVHGLAQPRAVFIRASAPIPFDAPDGAPVRTVLALVVPRPALAAHYELLSYYQRLLMRPDFRDELDACGEPGAVWRLFGRHAWAARLRAAA
jgi:PTS system nitrogen regulatory IIA component